MKKFLTIITILMSSLLVAKAQEQPGDDNQKQEKIQALYVAYVTKQLELTPEDAQKFWPVHTQFTNELKGVKQDLPELEKQQAILNIKKKYQDNFNRILGPQRCERFFRLRDDFNRKLLERFNKQRANQQRPKLRRTF
jgi:hypothetical protein